MISVVICIGP